MNSISANLNIMIKASEKASKILIRDFGEIEKLQVSKKGPSDFVTNSDLKAEKIIIEELRKAKPNYSIISEENGIENNKDTNNTWIIDPIDGTINFLHGVPHFAISIGLKTNDEIVAASDAFFPFVDGIEKLIQSGVSAVIQPAGSIKDKEIIKFANATGSILVFSKTRHFKH